MEEWMIKLLIAILVIVAVVMFYKKIKAGKVINQPEQPTERPVWQINFDWINWSFFKEHLKILLTLLMFIVGYILILWIFNTISEYEYNKWSKRYIVITTVLYLIGSVAYSINYDKTHLIFGKICFGATIIFFIISIINLQDTLREQTELKTKITKNEDGTVTVFIHPSAHDFEHIKFPYGKGTGDRALTFGFRNVIVKTKNGFEKTIRSEAASDVLGTNLKGSDKFLSAQSLTPTDTCYVWVRYDPKENPQGYTWK